MRMSDEHRQSGQTLILVALALIVLLGFVALAIEVGQLYGERRHMQNAADAGALAGARELCFGDPANAHSKAWEYAVDHNQATNAVISIDGGIVTVTAEETVDLLIAPVIGIDNVDVGAVAAAACGAANSACGLWPIALEWGRYIELYNNGIGCDGRPFYVWHGDNDNQLPDCTLCACDLMPEPDGDDIDDIVGGPSRGWIDFSDVVTEEYPDGCAQSGCGTNEMACWIEQDSTTILDLGEDGQACVAGLNGVRAGVKDEIDSRHGDSVSIPIYNGTDCGEESCVGGTSYNIVAFGCVTVNQWLQNYELPYQDGSTTGPPCWKGDLIEVDVACNGECATECGSTTGRPPEPWEVKAVSLIR